MPGVTTPTDQTPTPTRFLKNCEEVGLFNELASSFEHEFKKAAEDDEKKARGKGHRRRKTELGAYQGDWRGAGAAPVEGTRWRVTKCGPSFNPGFILVTGVTLAACPAGRGLARADF